MRSYKELARQDTAETYHRRVVEWALIWPISKDPKPAPPPVPDILKDD